MLRFFGHQSEFEVLWVSLKLEFHSEVIEILHQLKLEFHSEDIEILHQLNRAKVRNFDVLWDLTQKIHVVLVHMCGQWSTAQRCIYQAKKEQQKISKIFSQISQKLCHTKDLVHNMILI